MLELEGLQVRYGKSQAVHSVDLTVEDGEIVALLGRNGAGKSTTLKAIIGLLKPAGGDVRYHDKRLNGMSPYQIARRGIAYVPEERRVFVNLSVDENLRLAAMRSGDGSWDRSRIYDLFPRLGERATQRAGTMSGGEQQMLAIGRALASNPQIILLDEPLEGLAPSVAGLVEESIHELRKLGMTILLVEQDLEMALRVADRGYVLELGRMVMSGDSREFADNSATLERYLAV
jgi:branched-chain amino acid transport system ATP-binding protein